MQTADARTPLQSLPRVSPEFSAIYAPFEDETLTQSASGATRRPLSPSDFRVSTCKMTHTYPSRYCDSQAAIRIRPVSHWTPT